MRVTILAAAAAVLLMPATVPASACGTGHSAKAAATDDYSAVTKKKVVKKKIAKTKAPKVEYMRAAPM